ncbi:FMRFamide-related peptide-like family-containing protein [Strongyloides ratti]|uniref:FMRFamide-related peptide-like family-containing protein n=1 Tax=Strongyloides ratti TaxID=34506 RepID=A0A090L3S3_STRRB|nr:FMRFamide-related peptide-like family-containing protein [Strongyloides ratti]CEF62124.1 FMRFamide-related peptide-like family-containing protein [Strongyloides ratti]
MKYYLLITFLSISYLLNIEGNDEVNDSLSLETNKQLYICDVIPDHYLCSSDETISTPIKRKSAYMRFGRSDPDVVEKRKSAYMRFGKRSTGNDEIRDETFIPENGIEKRKSAYMRFGKRKSAYMRFGKRGMELENSADAFSPLEKRKSAYMRFGK